MTHFKLSVLCLAIFKPIANKYCSGSLTLCRASKEKQDSTLHRTSTSLRRFLDVHCSKMLVFQQSKIKKHETNINKSRARWIQWWFYWCILQLGVRQRVESHIRPLDLVELPEVWTSHFVTTNSTMLTYWLPCCEHVSTATENALRSLFNCGELRHLGARHKVKAVCGSLPDCSRFNHAFAKRL